MANQLKAITGAINRLLKRSTADENADEAVTEASAQTVAVGTECTLPADIDISSDVPYDAVPEVDNTKLYGAQGGDMKTFMAQAAGCQMTIRPELGEVNLRFGPGLQFEPPIARTRGGTLFEVVGAAQPAGETRMWFAARVNNSAGWVRGDLVNLSADCRAASYINPDDLVGGVASGPSPTGRFALPTSARITQGYRSSGHPGLDMGSTTGTRLITPADGVCIRLIRCTKCTEERPNRFPNASFQCPDLYKDVAWGFGYGNFLVIRHDYVVLPRPMRDEMDRRNLRNGFAYVLYAHLSRLNVNLGQAIKGGTLLGETGNTGCSTAPHLHFEVRIGNVTDVDNKWTQQISVNPNLMFEM